MGLINGSLQVGASAIRANEAAMQVIGNNVANASNPDYSRQRPVMAAVEGSDLLPGVQAGAGVQLESVLRMADEAVNARLRSATSDQSAADASQTLLSQAEQVFNALSDSNLGTQLTDFFNAFSNLANDPQSSAGRSALLQSADALTRTIHSYYGALQDERTQINSQVVSLTGQANQLIQQVASLNEQVTRVEFGLSGASAGSLRDQRDAALTKLSQLINIQTQPGTAGAINVFIGSTPLVMGTNTFLLKTVNQAGSGGPDTVVKFAGTGATAEITGGQIGGLTAVRSGPLSDALAGLNQFAVSLIGEVNKLHSEGQGLANPTSVTGTNAVTDADTALDQAGLTLAPVNGTFQLTATDSHGVTTTQTVAVNVNGTGAGTTLNSLASQIESLGHVSASVGPDGRLTIAADSGYTLSFSQDSSQVLAALGINTFFSGTGAQDISIRAGLTANDIAAATNGQPADNSNALRLGTLAETDLPAAGGISLSQSYQNVVSNLASASATAKIESEANGALTDNLKAQHDSFSGVSVDEEAVDLMKYQQAYQAAAHYISLIKQMMDEIVQLV